MNLDLSGKRALVCGSTSGIGRAAAVELALLGASVTLAARDPGKLGEALGALPGGAGHGHGTIVADFSKPAEAARAVAAGADASRPWVILVNNTGGPPPGPAAAATPEHLHAALDAMLVSAQLLVQALTPGMKGARYGRIVNVTSTSVKAPIPNLGLSNIIRAAVANWAKSLSQELGPFGITVNNVLPGYTATERLGSLVRGRAGKQGVSEAEVERQMMSDIPAGRFGTAEEVAAAIAFLATPAAAYINGINLPVDGGRLQSL
jgi:3-oxoacyl-[acyl-carrier protein] reductase